MHETKCELLMKYGYRCMLCGAENRYVQWHHIRPRYDFKAHGERPDDSLKNGSLLCANCHQHIHNFKYGDSVYMELTEKILANKGSLELKDP